MDNSKRDLQVLMAAGGLLLAVAMVFLWRELEVPSTVLAAFAAAGASVLASLLPPGKKPFVGTLALLGVTVASGLWYASTKEPWLLVALAVAFLGSGIAIFAGARGPAPARAFPGGFALVDDVDRRRGEALQWAALAVAGLACSWSCYFQLFTLGIAEEELARRMVLTLGWLVAGMVLVFFAYRRDHRAMRDAGFLFIAAAVGKALLYDTTHLSGGLRIAVLAVAGVLLLTGGYLTFRAPIASRSGR